MAAARRPGPGRPPVDIDLGRLEVLASVHCTYDELAGAFGLSTRTIERRVADDKAFREVIERGRADGRRALRRTIWGLALKANAEKPPPGALAALIFLCKQPVTAGGLGMSDRGGFDPADAPQSPEAAVATAELEAAQRDLEEKLEQIGRNRKKRRASAEPA